MEFFLRGHKETRFVSLEITRSMKKQYLLIGLVLLMFSGISVTSCHSAQYRKTKKIWQSLDRHSDCPDFNTPKKQKHKPVKGKKRKNK